MLLSLVVVGIVADFIKYLLPTTALSVFEIVLHPYTQFPSFLRPYSLFYDNTSPCPVRIRVEILVQSPSESESQSQSESPCHRPVQRLTSLLLASLPSLPSLSLPATPTMPSIPSTHPAAAFPSTFYERVKVDLLLLLLFVLATWNMLRVGLFNLQHLQLEHTEKEG